MPADIDKSFETSPDPSPLPDGEGRGRWVGKLRVFTRRAFAHSICPIILFILASTFLHRIDPGSKGEFYPFSNFPMYANPRNRDLEYYFVADGDDNPIAIHRHTGFTAARVKKLMRSQLQQWAALNGEKWNKKSRWMTDDIKSEAASEVLAYLRTRSHELANPLPTTIKMVRAIIFVDENRELGESSRAIAVDVADSESIQPTKS